MTNYMVSVRLWMMTVPAHVEDSSTSDSRSSCCPFRLRNVSPCVNSCCGKSDQLPQKEMSGLLPGSAGLFERLAAGLRPFNAVRDYMPSGRLWEPHGSVVMVVRRAG
ncbi:unnamed protein product [Amoebophrya sp. A25]|nr:unnamed protein product [Amoebophrya sp. A25]|eukprot:GSA25T00016268001.1